MQFRHFWRAADETAEAPGDEELKRAFHRLHPIQLKDLNGLSHSLDRHEPYVRKIDEAPDDARRVLRQPGRSWLSQLLHSFRDMGSRSEYIIGHTEVTTDGADGDLAGAD